MQTGSIKFFIMDRGFGFIVPNDGGPDVFVHVREMHKAGIQKLTPGQAVQFEPGPGKDGRLKAVKLQLATP